MSSRITRRRNWESVNHMPAVKLYANLRKLAGTNELSITGATVRAVLNELVERSPAVGSAILENGNLRPHIVVTINGHNMIDLDGTITDQDIMAIFPPIAGGQGEANVWLVGKNIGY